MSKSIVFFADGTWNGTDVDENEDGTPEQTNVLRLYHSVEGEESLSSLRLQNEAEKIAIGTTSIPIQVSKYLHGVGDSRNPIKKVLGGAFGSGIVSRIVRGYTFISRNYEVGDKIYLIGFSRGAYTVRALAGMIAKAGLLNYKAIGLTDSDADKARAYKRGLYVWAYYRQQREQNLARRAVSAAWRGIFERGTAVGEEQMITNVPIEAVGVWDTVGSLGIPIYGKQDKRIDLFGFADMDLNKKVNFGFHAMALDEHRVDFCPTLWTDRDGIEQVWFAGAHADIGGGYPEIELSDLALKWMADRLADAGLKLRSTAKFGASGKADGKWHDSYDAFPYRKKPRFFREVPSNAKLHKSVNDRQILKADYKPVNLSKWVGQYFE